MSNYYDGETVLLTGTIKPNIKVREGIYGHKGSIGLNQRLIDYYISIQFYIAYSDFKNIIFCENSNYKFDEQIKSLMEIAKVCNKNLEIIQFKGNDDALLSTYYGYGEGEIINYALQKSKLLQNCKNRYKITGRYIIENINAIIENNKKDDNLFFRLIFCFNVFAICTAFFKVNKEIYKKYLYDINDRLEPGTSLESLYYKVLKKTNIKSGKLSEIPHRIGRDSEWREINKYHKMSFYLGCWNYNGIIVYLCEKLIILKRFIFNR